MDLLTRRQPRQAIVKAANTTWRERTRPTAHTHPSEQPPAGTALKNTGVTCSYILATHDEKECAMGATAFHRTKSVNSLSTVDAEVPCAAVSPAGGRKVITERAHSLEAHDVMSKASRPRRVLHLSIPVVGAGRSGDALRARKPDRGWSLRHPARKKADKGKDVCPSSKAPCGRCPSSTSAGRPNVS